MKMKRFMSVSMALCMLFSTTCTALEYSAAIEKESKNGRCTQTLVFNASRTEVCNRDIFDTEAAVQTLVADIGGRFVAVAESGLEMQMFHMVNEERARYGLPSLKLSAHLSAAAQIRAQEIAKRFSHTRPDGSAWSTVSALAKGENIARGQRTAERVMAAWMTSEGHRKNILRESYGSIGVCALNVNGR